jgi:hydroxyacylglutathione hydrolase
MTIVATDDLIQIERLTLGPFETNCYIITCRQSKESIVVDAPARASEIIEHLKGKVPRTIAITHTHMDHLGALSELRSKLRIPVAAHPLDARTLSPPPEVSLQDGKTLPVGTVNLKVLHTPGHTPGSLCLMTGKYLISGDTIFPGGPGKTGSPADLRQIIDSIQKKIFPLPEDTLICPGHGETTTLGKEKEAFGVFLSRSHDPGLCGDVLWLSS